MEIRHDEKKMWFWTEVDNHLAHVAYVLTENGGLDIRHTIVPEEIGGRGIASNLVREAYNYARAHNLKPVATCSYAVTWLEKHPDYEGVVSEEYKAGSCAL